MKICKKQYRIVTDEFNGFEVQKRLLYFPFWFQIKGRQGFHTNSQTTIKESEELIEMDRKKNKPHIREIIKTYKCE